MSMDFLNNLISFDDKTDDILEQKIRENEANIQALENLDNLEENSNITKKEENLKENKEEENNYKESNNDSKEKSEENNHINKNFYSEEAIHKNINNDNNNEINKFEEINNSSITPIKKDNNLKENNSSSSNKINNITTTNMSNTNNSNLNINLSINNDNKKWFNDINEKTNKREKNNFPASAKRRNQRNVAKFTQSNSTYKNVNETYLYDNIDLSLYYQYTSLLSNQRIINKSAQKRQVNRNKKIKEKNNSMNKDLINDNFSDVYKRLIEGEKRQKEKIAQMKRNKEEQENKKYLYRPKINKKSIELTSKNKEDFYTRQKKKMEEKKKKEALLREKVKKKEKEEINKNNILLFNNLSKKNKNNKDRKKSVDEAIHKLYEWDKKRKEKINNKIKNKEKNLVTNIQEKPEINKKSYIITVNRNPNQIINRLYKIDIAKRKEKQELLNQIYTPTFQPNLIDKNNSASKIIFIRNKEEKHRHLNSFDNNNTNNKFSKKTFAESVENDDNFHNALRERIFGKAKNQSLFKSAVKLKVIRDDNSNNYHSNIEYSYNSKDKLLNNNSKKMSTSYIKKIKKKINYD